MQSTAAAAKQTAQSADLSERNTQSETVRFGGSQEIDGSQENRQESIANLAYALWQQRGCPVGSSEQDWTDAEQQLQNPRAETLIAGR